MSDLKHTKCGVSCGFHNITLYCFDCPALMCKSCDMVLHKQIKHNVIAFQNNNLSWSDKGFITGLFQNRNLGDKVFKEVNRKIDTKKGTKPEPEQERGSNTGWVCKSCTFKNESTSLKCDICCMFRVIEDFTVEYNAKLDRYTDIINPLFCTLDNIENAPFENSAVEYLRLTNGNIDFMTWFKTDYVGNKSLAVIGDLVKEFDHKVSVAGPAEKYSEYIKKKNQNFINNVPASVKGTVTEQSNQLLQIEHFNRTIVIPKEIINGKEISVEEVWKIIISVKNYTELQIRTLMIELNLPSVDNVKFLHLIMSQRELGEYLRTSCPFGNVKIEHVRQACIDHILIEDVINFLKKECLLCCSEYPMPGMQPFLICHHEICKNCFKEWLVDNVETRYPCKWGCPICGDEAFANVDKSLHYYNLKQFIVENNCGDDVLKLFDEKLLNERLMGSPNFHWCANEQCVNGFEAEGRNKKVQCPSCRLHMCVDCNREWKEQHENVTCEQYELWILKNDPNLAKVLNDIGIECPKCGMRYALAPGGCLHFNCKMCGWVFCGGCYVEFTSTCREPGCSLGTAFHGHHPRNCLYYMRDYSPAELENMLKNADYPKLKNKPDKKCPFVVAEEKTLANKPCNEPVLGTTGLCERHYKEYLVQFINRLQIDPATVANSNALNLILFQGLKKKLDKLKGESEDAFVVRLRNEVIKSCALYVPKGLAGAQANP